MKFRAVAFVLSSVVASFAFGQSTSFSASAEDWRGVTFDDSSDGNFATTPNDYGVANWNPSGFIEWSDQDPGYSYFKASSTFTGNKSAYFGSTLNYQLNIGGPTATDPLSIAATVVLQGGGKSIGYFGGPTPALNDWTEFTIPLSSTGWRYDSSLGAEVTEADFQSVLTNLSALYIKTEYVNGIVETYALDNVQFGPVPEPASIAALSLAGFSVLRRKRRA